MELVDINYAPKYKIHCQVPGFQKRQIHFMLRILVAEVKSQCWKCKNILTVNCEANFKQKTFI